MSWDAYLTDDRGHEDGSWNYTYNTTPMIHAAVDGLLEAGQGWGDRLDGKSGPEGAAWLHEIITRLEADPERFRAMNPPNGWGSYDGLLDVLREMRAAVPEWPTVWSKT